MTMSSRLRYVPIMSGLLFFCQKLHCAEVRAFSIEIGVADWGTQRRNSFPTPVNGSETIRETRRIYRKVDSKLKRWPVAVRPTAARSEGTESKEDR